MSSGCQLCDNLDQLPKLRLKNFLFRERRQTTAQRYHSWKPPHYAAHTHGSIHDKECSVMWDTILALFAL